MTEDIDWIADLTGGSVTRFEQTTAGRSRGTWLVDVESEHRLELVLRRDTGDGPLSGTELSLRRESVVYEALRDTAVPVPQLFGVAPDGEALLVERVRGTEDLDQVHDEAERSRIVDSFVDALATLHRVEVDGLDLPGFSRPATPREHAGNDLKLWQKVLDDRVSRPAPLFRFALRWLAENAPEVVQRTVFCHGDAGPGNFLFENGAVTALLDWEFGHLGDPMDDLAWFVIRSHDLRTGCGDLGAHLRRYSDASGIDIDPAAIQYYRAFVLTRMGIACLAGLDHRSGAMDASTYFALLPLFKRLLVTVLTERLGATPEPTELPDPGPATPRSEVLQTLGTDLGTVILHDLVSEHARSRATGMALLIGHLQIAETLAPALESDDLYDLTDLLGSLPGSVADGLAKLDSAVREATSPDDDLRILGFFGRHTDREVALWPVVAAMATIPMTPVEVG